MVWLEDCFKNRALLLFLCQCNNFSYEKKAFLGTREIIKTYTPNKRMIIVFEMRFTHHILVVHNIPIESIRMSGITTRQLLERLFSI